MIKLPLTTRLIFPSLDKPRGYKGYPESPETWQGTFLIPKQDFESKDFQAALEKEFNAAKEKFESKSKSKVKQKLSLTAFIDAKFSDGDDSDYPTNHGCMVISAKASKDYRPAMYLPNKSQATPEDLYAGCYVVAGLALYIFEARGKIYQGFNLIYIQKVREGERIGGGNQITADDLDDYSQAEFNEEN